MTLRLWQIVLLAGLVLPAVAHAEDAAQRQLDFCWEELKAGEHDKAVKSATSAFRLDSNKHDALVCKAEALAAADKLDLARGTLAAYVQLRLGLKPSERAGALMKKIGVNEDGSVAGAVGGDALPPIQAGLMASEVLQDYCADAKATNPETRADAVEAAAPALGKVAASYRVHGEPFLLYWRGVLSQCLSQDEEARSDLFAFVAALGEDPQYRNQTIDAKRRLRMLGGDKKAASGPGPVPGIILAAAGGALGGVGAGLHGAAWNDGQAGTPELYGGTAEEYDALMAQNQGGFGLLIGGAATAVVGVVVAIAGGSSGSKVAAAVVPTPDGGVIVALGGRW